MFYKMLMEFQTINNIQSSSPVIRENARTYKNYSPNITVMTI